MYRFAVRGAIALAVIAPLAALSRPASHSPIPVPEATVTSLPAAPGLQTIVLAGGCFWGIEAVFEHVKGVTDAVSGYAGGTKEQADYETVSTGTTGHAESVKVTFDPTKVSLEKLLQVFFSVATDPTQLNRQGPDVGPQYRSAIFFADEDQARVARAYIDQLTKAKVYSRPIVTQVVKLQGFYPAEEYHQNFAERNPTYPYIVYNDAPKVANLKKQFPDLYRQETAVAAREH
ncbi:MAG TPA: peptide-methionine (S)-S-oxide reductase MsrA [Gemmatimonadaceae bacterium]|nr:peptide-methionine (S)-S-oxide reductase MsrA [Gemmatimonadaceae bacterium]